MRKKRMYLTVEEQDSNNACILTGHLNDEPTSLLTVSGCPGHGKFQLIAGAVVVFATTLNKRVSWTLSDQVSVIIFAVDQSVFSTR